MGARRACPWKQGLGLRPEHIPDKGLSTATAMGHLVGVLPDHTGKVPQTQKTHHGVHGTN